MRTTLSHLVVWKFFFVPESTDEEASHTKEKMLRVPAPASPLDDFPYIWTCRQCSRFPYCDNSSFSARGTRVRLFVLTNVWCFLCSFFFFSCVHTCCFWCCCTCVLGAKPQLKQVGKFISPYGKVHATRMTSVSPFLTTAVVKAKSFIAGCHHKLWGCLVAPFLPHSCHEDRPKMF